MPITSRDFAAQNRAVSAMVGQAGVAYARRFLLETRRLLAARNPVLTGRSAASWNASVGRPDTRHQPATYNNPGGRLADGRVAVDRWPVGATGHITNTVPYIERLEHGHSKQQPNGWVLATLVEQGLRAGGRGSLLDTIRSIEGG